MRFTIKAKLILTFGVLIAAIAVLVGVSLSHLSSLHAAIHEVVAGPAAQLSRAQSIQTEFSSYVRRERGMLLTTDPEAVREFSEEARNRMFFSTHQTIESDLRNRCRVGFFRLTNNRLRHSGFVENPGLGRRWHQDRHANTARFHF